MSLKENFMPNENPFTCGCCTNEEDYQETHIRAYVKNNLRYHDHPDATDFEMCDGCDEKQLVKGQRMDSSSSQHQVNLKS